MLKASTGLAQVSLSLKVDIMVRRTLLTASLLSATVSLASAACVKTSGNSSSSLVAASYFAGYHIDDGFPVSSIPWDRYTEVKYAFA